MRSRIKASSRGIFKSPSYKVVKEVNNMKEMYEEKKKKRWI